MPTQRSLFVALPLCLIVILIATGTFGRKIEKRCINCSYSPRAFYNYADDYSVAYPYYRDYPYYAQSRADTNACYGTPCGLNAICQETASGYATCTCPSGYLGNPLVQCNRGECQDNVDCRADLQCRDGHCVNPCLGTCGVNAHCEPRSHVAVCSCPNGYVGDPFTQCRRVSADELCHPTPCGANTKCEAINGVPTCSCLPSYRGNPLTGCRHECDHDGDCQARDMCRNFKCVPACRECGIGATCNVINHRAVCECPKNYIGSPHSECRPECYSDAECPSNKPSCYYGNCKNPCDGACGQDAECRFHGRTTPVCSCPHGTTGDPFVRCRPLTKEDYCLPNPCGRNAICLPGHDSAGNGRPVCNCPPGHTGNPLTHCTRGDCLNNSECPDNKACLNYQCVNPCLGKCAAGATCEAKSHSAVCKCPPGYVGDAILSCHQSRSIAVARYN